MFTLSLPRGGTVRYFNSERRFGILVADSGEDVLFHAQGYRSASVSQNGIITFDRFVDSYTDRAPKEGDQIVFEFGENINGKKTARPWTYFDGWEELLTKRHEILTRPRPIATPPKLSVVQNPPGPITLYRVVERRESLEGWGVGSERFSNTIRFVGNLKDLNRFFPRSEDWRHDSIPPESEDEEYRVDRHFEQNMGLGNRWTPCEDPRSIVSSTVLRQRFGR